MSSDTLSGVFGPYDDGDDAEAPSERAYLLTLVGPQPGRRWAVADRAVVGRGADAAIQVTADDVSRDHARIEAQPGGDYVIIDLGSRNGTYVNGERVERQALHNGDKIGIAGKVVLLFTRYNILQDKLLQSHRLESIGRLAGGIAHDFNNILGAMQANIGYLQTLPPSSPVGGEAVRDCILDIEAAIDRAGGLTRQLLDFARGEKREERTINLSDLVQGVARLVRRTFDRSITLELDLANGVAVAGDRSQLHQVVMNLLINARDAMPTGGKLTVSTRLCSLTAGQLVNRLPFLAPGDFAIIRVTDAGSGMDEETRGHIFDPFFTTKRKSGGTGLGLATAYGVTRAHGGDIEVLSALGEGTSMIVYLPAADGQTAEASPLKDTLSGRQSILVVDDEPAVRRATQRLLEQLGYCVKGAADALEAVQIFQAQHRSIDLIMLDLVLPGMSGEDAYRQLVEIDAAVPVLLTTGTATSGRVRALLREGVAGCLHKPYDLPKLQAALAKVFGQREPR